MIVKAVLGGLIFLLSAGELLAQVMDRDLLSLKRSVVKLVLGEIPSESRFGTGFVVKRQPDAVYIVTSAQLVRERPDPKVVFFSQPGRLFQGTVLDGAQTEDPLKGLAVVRVTKKDGQASGADVFKLTGRSEVKGGERVTFIGHSAERGDWASIERVISSRGEQNIFFDPNVTDGFLGAPMLVNGQAVGMVASTKNFGVGVGHRTVHNYIEDTIYKDYRHKPQSKPQKSVKTGAQEPSGTHPGTAAITEKKQQQGSKSSRNSTKSWQEPLTEMEFVWVKGGCFPMGCNHRNGACELNEQPSHEVCLRGFWMGKFEVTQNQWQRVMNNNPSFFKRGLDHPVESVSWDDARQYIVKLNQKSRRQFRLPTEAEWEYACRSGGQQETYSGGEAAQDFAWYFGNSGLTSHPVGKRQPNRLGLFDMSGNVYEWVADWYQEDYYRRAPRSNPVNASANVGRVLRGASWYSKAQYTRCANRNRYRPGHRNQFIGFRLVYEGGR